MAKEKRAYNAKLNGKGLESSLSEEQAREFSLHQGTPFTLLIQGHSGRKMVEEDGSEVVQMIPDHVELVPAEHVERVRQFQRALYLARPGQYGQQPFEGSDDEPKVSDAAAQLDAVVEVDESGEPTGIWDGSTEPDDTNVAPLFKDA